VCRHVETTENTHYEQEGITEETTERIIIPENGADSSNSSSEGCSDNSERERKGTGYRVHQSLEDS
jgi:hypothetical protein